MLACFAALIGGYFLYGRLAEKVYGFDAGMEMPCKSMADGVDYVAMPVWKVFLIQLLNIAGLGPVVGALSGCLFGPVALLWIVIGCIFAGALHDFLAALMSAEYRGANLPEVLGRVMGSTARRFMGIVCVFLLLLVGVVFTMLPASMLHALLPTLGWSALVWGLVILLYYFLATILPIQTIIGRIYPIFGGLFLFMTVGLMVGLPLSGHTVLPELDVTTNFHPQQLGIWPMIFVTIACGAISGFHATQSPMMVRCLVRASSLRRVFYGAMIVEGMVALIWAAVGLSLRETVFEVNGESLPLADIILRSPSLAVNEVCRELLGHTGAFLAVLGVVVLAITSGDTAMRCCRLMTADMFHLPQKKIVSRLALALPIFILVIIISQLDFSTIWRYFGWANQTLACLTLWCITLFLRQRSRGYWISLLPALFMSLMCVTFLLHSPDCRIEMPLSYATAVGALLTLGLLLVFLLRRPADKPNQE